MTWKEKVLQTLKKAKDKVVEIDLDKKTITYNKSSIFVIHTCFTNCISA
jgi:hypothetical protein